MLDFRAPVADILFSVEHVANGSTLPGWDNALTKAITENFSTFAENVIAPLNSIGDREGSELIDGRVIMPDGFRQVYHQYLEQGWHGLSAPAEYDGQGLGATHHGIVSEIFTGACHSMQMCVGLSTGAIRTLMRFGTNEQKKAFIPDLVSGKSLATMCLTEPQAGSDLSRIRCSGEKVNGRWWLDGDKCFISNGDQNISERILHLVLARTSCTGLSLFVCMSERPDGSRNSVSVTRIESKMGLRASPTCQLMFRNAEAELLGQEGRGLQTFFTMMNHARMDVALQGVAHSARAHAIASAYAAEREQGRQANGASAQLRNHSDVQRMLDEMDCLTIGARAMAHTAMVKLDSGDCPELVDFLTPVIKVFCTDAGIRSADLGIQILGGYGYIQDYQIEQVYRDARITAIYEGTNGIHAQAHVSRGLNDQDGVESFVEFVRETSGTANNQTLQYLLDVWSTAVHQYKAQKYPPGNAYYMMQLTSHLLCFALWTRIDQIAGLSDDPGRYKHLFTVVSKEVPDQIEMCARRFYPDSEFNSDFVD